MNHGVYLKSQTIETFQVVTGDEWTTELPEDVERLEHGVFGASTSQSNCLVSFD